MSMMKSEELLKVCESVFTQLQDLGFSSIRNAQIYIRNDEERKFWNYSYSDELGGELIEVPYDIHKHVRDFQEVIFGASDALSEFKVSKDELENWKSFLRNTLKQKPEAKLDAAKELDYYFYSIGTGALGITTFAPVRSSDTT